MTFHPVTEKIEQILREGKFWYQRFEHEPVRTSEEAAKVRPEYERKQGSKSLILKAKRKGEAKRFIMVVVPGDRQFDKNKLKTETGFEDMRFATPEEVSELTLGVIPGGVPPWGNLFGLPVFADAALFENEKIIFNAGDRRISIAMYAKGYLQLVGPIVKALS